MKKPELEMDRRANIALGVYALCIAVILVFRRRNL